MNQLQETELNLLKSFVDICNKLNLNYYLVCGTALGAVKYGGFIPWDDDVDVGLPREDYDVFCEKAQELLPEGFFLQTYTTDNNYPCIFAKIRNSNTTYIEKTCSKISMNHGVYIDVFPLDGYPEDKGKQKKLEFKKRIYRHMIFSAVEGECGLPAKVLRSFFRFFGVHKRTKKVLAKYEKLISAYPTATSRIWCNHGNWQGVREYFTREQYGDGIEMNFETIKVRVPEKYDDYLTQKYGDWRSDPPKDEQVGHHYYSVMDLNKSYIEYIKGENK